MKRRKKAIILILGIVLYLSLMGTTAIAGDLDECNECHPNITENFTTSIHYLGRESPSKWSGGATVGHFGINLDSFYAESNCSKCHIVTCKNCHEGGHGSEITMGTCGKCHHKEIWFSGSTLMGKGENADIHYEKGLTCTDCHTLEELHGNGIDYSTMPLRITKECEECHINPGKTVRGMNVMQYSPDMPSHKMHEEKLDCIACHAGYIPSCGHCHLDNQKTESFTADKFCLAKDDDGKIKPFLKTSSIYENETNILWVEWMPHTTTNQARDCKFCHENPEVICSGDEGMILEKKGSFLSEEEKDKISGIEISEEDLTESSEPTKTTPTAEEPTPGFEAIFAISGVLGVAYLVRRFKK